MKTKEVLAAELDGKEYPLRLSHLLRQSLKENNLVIVSGASDDLMEFEGAFTEELGAPGTAFITAKGLLPEHDEDCECKFCGYATAKADARKIEAFWCEEPGGPCWTFKTEIPHATFLILEDGDPFCRGVVFSMDELGGKASEEIA